MTKELRAALDEQRPYAAYSKSRSHGIHTNKDHDCREYVVGECFIEAALALLDQPASKPDDAGGIDVLRDVRDEFAAMRHGPDPSASEMDAAYYAGHDEALEELLRLLEARLTNPETDR